MSKQSVQRIAATPLQAGLLLVSRDSPGSGAYVQQVVCDFREPVAPERLRACWRELHARHPALRMEFRLDTVRGWEQTVAESVVPTFRFEDWHDQAPALSVVAFRRFLKRDRQLGFPLAAEIPSRAALFRLGENRFRLVWTFHHALLDGRSHTALLKELLQAYDAGGIGRGQPKTSISAHFDCLAWLDAWDARSSAEYWKSRLAGGEALTAEFAGQTPHRGVSANGPAEELQLSLSESETNALHRLCEQLGVSLNVVALAGWALIVASYTDEHDVVVGTVRSCRKSLPDHFGAANGLLINCVPMRFQISAGRSVQDWLRDISDRWRQTTPHQLTPGRALREFAEWPSSRPLFSTIHVHEHKSLEEAITDEYAPVRTRRARLINGRTEAPVSISTYGGHRFHACVTMENRLLEILDGRQLCQRYLGFLRQFVADPSQAVVDLNRLTPREQDRFLAMPGVCLPHSASSANELFLTQVNARSTHLALVDKRGPLTYGQLHVQSEALKKRIENTGRAGIVGIIGGRGSNFVVAMCAAMGDQRGFVPLDPDYPEERLAFVLSDCGCRVLVTDRRHLQLAERLFAAAGHSGSIVLNDEDLSVETGHPEVASRSSAIVPDLVYLVYTSGTTGKPKGVPITSANLLPLMHWQQVEFELGPQTRTAQTLSVSFDFGLQEIFTTLLFGGTLFSTDDALVADPDRYVDFLIENEITMVYATPSFTRALVLLDRPLPSLRVVLLGGEKLDWRLVEDIRRLLDGECRLFNGYGPTEATMNCAMYRIDAIDASTAVGSSVPIGLPSGLSRLYVLGREGRLLPAGVPGELHVGGPGVADGYLNRPQLTAERFVPDKFDPAGRSRLYRTGDRVRQRPDGNLEFLGRTDNQVKIRGYRIELEEIDNALAIHPGLHSAAAAVAIRNDGDTQLVAFAVSRDVELDGRGVQRFLRRILPGYMVPALVHFVAEIPLTVNGKADRARLLSESTVPSVAQARTPATHPREAHRDSFEHWFYRPCWRPASPWDAPHRRATLSLGPTLVYCDEGPLGRAVVALLHRDGVACETVHGPVGAVEPTQARHVVDPLSRTGHETLLRSLRASGRLPESIVYLWPLTDTESTPGSAFDTGFERLLCLLQAIAGVYRTRPVAIAVVTANAQPVGMMDLLRPRSALLRGLCRAVAVELPKARIVSIDVDARDLDSTRVAAALIVDLAESPAGTVIAYRGGRRLLWCLERIQVKERDAPALRAGGTYIVTGGLGGIGLTLAKCLAREAAGNILLIDVPGDSGSLGDKSRVSRNALARELAEIRALGAQVTVSRANVTQRDELSAALAKIRSQHGRIHGVIHAAGRVRQAVLRRLTAGDAWDVIAPKVVGAELLAEMLVRDPLDFVVYCSSIDAIRGSFAQADYCAANAFLDAHAQCMAQSGRPFVSVNWDVWQRVGMAAKTSVAGGLQGARAVELSLGILPDEGQRAFMCSIQAAEPQVVVSTFDPLSRIGRFGATLDVAEAMSAGHGPSGTVSPQRPGDDLEATVRNVMAEILGNDLLTLSDDFFELGGDSLAAMRVVARLRDELGIDIPFGSLFEAPSAAELAQLLSDESSTTS